MQDTMKNCIKILNSQNLIAFYAGKVSVDGVCFTIQMVITSAWDVFIKGCFLLHILVSR